jgi:hypothetical protein
MESLTSRPTLAEIKKRNCGKKKLLKQQNQEKDKTIKIKNKVRISYVYSF